MGGVYSPPLFNCNRKWLHFKFAIEYDCNIRKEKRLHSEADDFLVSILRGTSAYSIVMWIVIVVSILAGAVYLFIRIFHVLESYRKVINDFEEKNALISKHNGEIKELKCVDKETNEEIVKLNNKIDNIYNTIVKMQDNNDAKDRARLKDRISDMYQKYNEKKEWSVMEREAMEGLIASYESCGGENSFVHSKVQPEMYTWKVRD